MKRKKPLPVDDSLASFQEIARVATRQALEAYDVPDEYHDNLVLGTRFEGSYRIFDAVPAR